MHFWRLMLTSSMLVLMGGQSLAGTAVNPIGRTAPASRHVGGSAGKSVGLGVVLTTEDGGEIDGFDVDQAGDDGVLSSSGHIETFDQTTGKITSAFPSKVPATTSYGVDGIFAGDVALITRFVVPKGQIYAKRFYDVMNPVTAKTFTGAWTPPLHDVGVLQDGQNQTTTTSVLYAIELKNQDQPDLIVSDVGSNTFSKVFHLNPTLFSLGTGPQLAQDTATNQAVIALSPDGGAVGGSAPINALIDLATGNVQQFTGLNNGPYGAGEVNGLAVDSNTGIAATTTELNAQVEFYDLANQTGIGVQLPCTGPGDQGNSGFGVANDSKHKLFLVMDPSYCSGSQGSAIVVYDEAGNLVETITGFNFFIAEPAAVINPSKRIGWAWGPGFDKLQQFRY